MDGQPEIIGVPAQRALSPTQIDLADFVINPYKGCGFGCDYCYARANKSLQKIDRPWGSYVYVKEGFLQKLKEELSVQKNIGRVLIGSTTEPFQKAEDQYHLTRDILILLKTKKIPVVLLTKSDRAAECADLLNYSDRNSVYMTVNSEIVRTLFEKDSPPQEARLTAVEKLVRAGISTTIYVSPVFPLLTDLNTLFFGISSLAHSANRICLEAYNPKMGNWNEVKQKLNQEQFSFFQKVYSSAEEYGSYWRSFQDAADKMNHHWGFHLQFLVPPFDSFYNS